METNSAGHVVWQAALRWQRAINAELSELDLTCAQFFALRAVGALSKKEPPQQRDVAVRAGFDTMTTSQLLRSLESKQLVSRAVDKADKRGMRLALTANGARVLAKAQTRVNAVDRKVFGSRGSQAVKLLAPVLVARA